MSDLIAAFKDYFEVVPADTPQLLEETFRLRYQVYCQEMHFEDSSQYPGDLEMDDYDPRSVHILLRHRPSGSAVGTVRLVLADPVDPDKPFPIEEHARFEPGFAGVPKRLRRHTAEISRLAILRRFPHHAHEHARSPSLLRDTDNPAMGQRRRFPHPLLALAVGIMRMSATKGITHWYALMDSSLNRLLSQYDLHLQTIGPVLDYHGLRRPHFDSVEKVMDKAYQRHREIWELLTDDGRLWPAPSKEILLSRTRYNPEKSHPSKTDPFSTNNKCLEEKPK